MPVGIKVLLFCLLFTCSSCLVFRTGLITPEEALSPRYSNAVVKIEANNGRGMCTGFHIGKSQILTAAHCLPDGAELFALLGKNLLLPSQLLKVTDRAGRAHSVSVSRVDVRTDLVLLSAPTFNGPALSLGRGLPREGSSVVVLGFPGYYGGQFTFDVMRYKGIYVLNPGTTDKRDLVVTTKGVAPGYSGGPLISLETGKVIGVVHAIIARQRYLNPITGVHIHDDFGLSVPSPLVLQFLSE